MFAPARLLALSLLLSLLLLSCETPTGPQADEATLPRDLIASTGAPVDAVRAAFPDQIPLPNGFQPEGIAIGPGHTFYVGSLLTGAIVRGDLRTGAIEELVSSGAAALGMDHDDRSGLLWVANGPLGTATAYDAESGALVETFDLGGVFVNDVAVTREAAYFTDSFAPSLYVVPLGPGGQPSHPGDAYALPLSGDYAPAGAPLPGFPAIIDANGIVATPNGKWLIIVNTTTGVLYRVDPETGEASAIDLGGADPLITGDGLALEGKKLYVMQNFLNQIAVVDLAPDLLSGDVADVITNDDLSGVALDIPAAAVIFGDALYVVNANFDDANPFDPDLDLLPTIPFEVVRASKH